MNAVLIDEYTHRKLGNVENLFEPAKRLLKAQVMEDPKPEKQREEISWDYSIGIIYKCKKDCKTLLTLEHFNEVMRF